MKDSLELFAWFVNNPDIPFKRYNIRNKTMMLTFEQDQVCMAERYRFNLALIILTFYFIKNSVFEEMEN